MNGEETYIAEVKRRLVGVNRGIKEDIAKELRTHIADLVKLNGGNVQAAMVSLDSPSEVARKYRQLYGYGTPFKALFVLLATILAVPTLPVLQTSGEEAAIPVITSLVFLAMLVTYIIFVAVKAGKIIGLVAGLAACFARIVLLGLLVLLGGEAVVVQGGGAGLLVVVSILLVLLGYIPGEAKARWTRPSGEI